MSGGRVWKKQEGDEREFKRQICTELNQDSDDSLLEERIQLKQRIGEVWGPIQGGRHTSALCSFDWKREETQKKEDYSQITVKSPNNEAKTTVVSRNTWTAAFYNPNAKFTESCL